jgi:hypothetical protein
MCRSYPMRCVIDQGIMFSSRDKEFFFHSGFRRIRSHTIFIVVLVLTHLRCPDRAVFNTPEFLTMFNCTIDKISQNFQWFQEVEILRI